MNLSKVECLTVINALTKNRVAVGRSAGKAPLLVVEPRREGGRHADRVQGLAGG